MSLQDLPNGAAEEARIENNILGAVARVARYLREQRKRLLPESRPLGQEQRGAMAPFFSRTLLDTVRIVELTECRLENPPSCAEVKVRGFSGLPDMTHMASFTFEDVVAFQEKPTDRILFHGLVRAVQFRMLGLERYTELFVRSFVRVSSHFLVPLEAHAYALGAKFVMSAGTGFSVEEEVRMWIKQGLYASR